MRPDFWSFVLECQSNNRRVFISVFLFYLYLFYVYNGRGGQIRAEGLCLCFFGGVFFFFFSSCVEKKEHEETVGSYYWY